MKTFAYQGFDHSGRSSAGLVEALDAKEAREKLFARGILVEGLRPAGQGKAGRFRRTGAFDASARAMVYRELAALLKAGLPLTQALEIILSAPETGAHQMLLADTRDRLREGSSFAEALAAHRAVTPFEKSVVQVGERTGTLDVVLDRIARFLEEESQVRERIQTALLYPVIVLIMAIAIGMLTMGVMLPRMARLLEEANMDLPAITRFTLALGRWSAPVLLLLIVALGLAGGWLVRRMRAAPEVRQLWNRRAFRWPLAGRMYTALVNLRFARTLALLLDGGVPLVEALPLAGRATGSSWTGRLAAEQAEAMRHGRNLADALRQIPPLAGSLPVWIQAGEAGGKLSVLLEHAADRYQQQWSRVIARSLGLLEPLLIVLVGGFVLLVALATLLPILSLNQTLH
ncbi:MAG TPA: type II secretion system F family protein [Kiritimatiellia bacterium]|nr:type II secretion system F family protein [Kiritimatiellia bacterium]HRZ13020.1 type II secretion system F family protein [Kiritimatiellia bacterium]HSA18370.1 type II secretion system F family protein [Kiritimatiellia bacterium]